MRKLGIVLLGLILAIPAYAATSTDEVFTGVPGTGSPSRTNDCPGAIVWDTGMFDNFTPPTSCSSAGSAGCFINAIDEGIGVADGRRLGDDWTCNDFPGYDPDPMKTYVTHVKVWNRYNAQGYTYRLANPGSLHGFCVKFYEMLEEGDCPDGLVDGEEAIGPIVYTDYCPDFVEYEITTGLPRNFNACIALPCLHPFEATVGHTYFVSVSADFDFVSWEGGVTQWFWRLCNTTVGYSPFCESSWWDTWNTPATFWKPTSVALNLPCWAGWEQAFVLYENYVGACCLADGSCVMMTESCCLGQVPPGEWQGAGVSCLPNPCEEPPVPTENKTWGQIKHDYR